MTERLPTTSSAAARAPARRRPRFWPTAVASIACFAVIFEFLAFQLRGGNDPALGAGPVTAATPKRPVVINRRIVQRRVVHLPPRQTPAAAGSLAGSAVPATPATPAPAAPVAPAPAAPAAPPAPAAPVTSSS
jgi:hypothetical protein